MQAIYSLGYVAACWFVIPDISSHVPSLQLQSAASMGGLAGFVLTYLMVKCS